MPSHPASRSPAPAVSNALRILELLRDESPRWLGVSEIARLTALPKASTHRFLLALLDRKYVMRNPRDMTYTLGAALIELGGKAAGEGPALEIIRTTLAELAHETQMSAEAFQLMPDGQVVCVAACAGPGPVALSRPVGSTIPVLPMLSYLHLAWSDRDGTGAPDPIADGAIAPGPYFDDDLDGFRERGYAWVMTAGENTEQNLADIGRWLEGVAALGIGRRSAQGRAAQVSEISRYTDIRNTHARSRLSMLPVLGLIAPVFNANGEAPIRLCTISLLAQVKPGDLDDLGRTLRTKADEATDILGGCRP